jgi:hypothetical protein
MSDGRAMRQFRGAGFGPFAESRWGRAACGVHEGHAAVTSQFAEIVADTQPHNLALYFNNLRRRVISL